MYNTATKTPSKKQTTPKKHGQKTNCPTVHQKTK
jgi:hypothetical protein